jgi:Domain of unknown function (DUF3854)/Domain of unknown function (DUF927)
MVEKLAENHRKKLVRESRIARGVIRRRGYRTVRTKAELERLGFGRAQRNVPGLLIPLYDPTGEVVLYQFRPDEPRISGGRPVKYETPSGARVALDVHPFALKRLDHPTMPLLITEGIRKGDALVSRGLCAVALVGVWNWRGTNEHGGKTALPQWEQIALNGRQVYIVFDSDVMLKKEVHAALVRLKAFLESRDAKVALVYLPPGEGGTKQGVDDYFAAGHGMEDLLALATTEMRSLPQDDRPANPYRTTPEGLLWDRPTPDGPTPVPLTNFTAKITADVAEDDGVEVRRRFEIEANLGERRAIFTIPATRFFGMGWPAEHLGANAVIYPGFSLKDHTRAAVQLLSGEVPSRRVFTHTGWREIDGEWCYLHSGGASGPHGPVGYMCVELEGTLGNYMLPDPPEGRELNEAIRASLGLLDLAPDNITVPLLAATFRAALGETDFSLHLSGPTGEGKSELAALCQQHFGSALDARHLLSWESTDNAIEGLAFGVKDAVLVLDDFAPHGTSYDTQRLHKKADRVLRAAGNRSGRSRMRPDTTLRPHKPPRCLFVSTGEDVPRGQSLRARMIVIELGPDQLNFRLLTACQKEAADGGYARAMAGYIRWLASRYGAVKAHMRDELDELREAARGSGQHRRTPEIVANLALGLRYLLKFALDTGTVSVGEAQKLWERGWRCLGEAAEAQSQHHSGQEPTRRFMELLSAAIASGRAHVADPKGENPERPGAWGWRFSGEEWRPQGERVGWVDGKDLYLVPEAACSAAQRQGRDAGDPLSIVGRTLNKRLHERGLLISTEDPHLTVRRALQGKRRRVLHLATDILSQLGEEAGQVGHGDADSLTLAENQPPLWPSNVVASGPHGRSGDEEVGHGSLAGPLVSGEVGHQTTRDRAAPRPVGPDGPVLHIPEDQGGGGAYTSDPSRIKGRI